MHIIKYEDKKDGEVKQVCKTEEQEIVNFDFSRMDGIWMTIGTSNFSVQFTALDCLTIVEAIRESGLDKITQKEAVAAEIADIRRYFDAMKLQNRSLRDL